jgi:hypothetical protein
MSPEDAHEYAMQVAKEAYIATMDDLGISGEYAEFPGLTSCKRGPFDPSSSE